MGRRLVILLLGLGVVLMHHVVADHPDHPDHPDRTAAPAATALPAVPAVPVVPGDHHGQDGDDRPDGGVTMLLHLCLAVLVAGIVLAAATLLGRRPPTTAPARPGTARPAAAPPARPPPTARRLADLQVLRR